MTIITKLIRKQITDSTQITNNRNTQSTDYKTAYGSDGRWPPAAYSIIISD